MAADADRIIPVVTVDTGNDSTSTPAEAVQDENSKGDPCANNDGHQAETSEDASTEIVIFNLPSSLDTSIEWQIPRGMEDLYYSIYCPICQEYCTDELRPHCAEDHVICNECTDLVLNTGATECPHRCGNLLLAQAQCTKNTAARALQNFLRIPCKNRVFGCAELPKVVHSEEHALLCDYRRKDCPYESRGCRQKVVDDWEHKKECEFRPVQCKNTERGCPMDDVNFKNLEFHETHCRHRWAPVGTLYERMEGAGEENQGGPQQRWYRLEGFWIQRTCTMKDWIGINDIYQNSGTPTSQADAYERLLDSEYTWARRLEDEDQVRANLETEQMIIDLERRNNAGEFLLSAEDLLAEDPSENDLIVENIPEEVMRELLEISDNDIEVTENQENTTRNTQDETGADAPIESEDGPEDQDTDQAHPAAQTENEVSEEDTIEPAEEGEQVSYEEQEMDEGNEEVEEHLGNVWNGATEPATTIQDLVQAINSMHTNATDCMGEDTFNSTMNTAEGQINWAQEEWNRITGKKCENFLEIRGNAEYPGYGPYYCEICSETSSPIFPSPEPVFHVHHSSRLAMLERIHNGQVDNFNCMSGCRQINHLPKPNYRRKLLITSSTLKQWDTDAKDDPNVGYLGNEEHIDLLSIPGGSLEEILHALWIEVEGSTEAIDIIAVAGLNNCLNTLSLSQNGINGMDSVVKAVHCLTGLIRSSKAKNTIAFARIPKVPMLHLSNRGPLVDAMNKMFRMTNAAMTNSWGTNAKYAPVFETWGLATPAERHRGTPVMIRRDWFREPVETRMLHFTTPIKLEMGRVCMRFLGLSRGLAVGRNAMSRS